MKSNTPSTKEKISKLNECLCQLHLELDNLKGEWSKARREECLSMIDKVNEAIKTIIFKELAE